MAGSVGMAMLNIRAAAQYAAGGEKVNHTALLHSCKEGIGAAGAINTNNNNTHQHNNKHNTTIQKGSVTIITVKPIIIIIIKE